MRRGIGAGLCPLCNGEAAAEFCKSTGYLPLFFFLVAVSRLLASIGLILKVMGVKHFYKTNQSYRKITPEKSTILS
jgi:hypothetical protein